jgi:SAM-dependent methyltransferase
MELLTEGVKKLYLQSLAKDEFEIIIDQKQMNMAKFMILLKYIGHQHINLKLPVVKENVLDICLTDANSYYRLTVDGKENIQTVINNHHLKKNIQVFHSLLQEAKSNIGNYSIMIKNRKGVIEQQKYKCRLSSEKIVDPNSIKLKEDDRHNIVFRYKQRATLILYTSEYGKLKLDVTQVQQSTQLNLLTKSPIVYEAELDFSLDKKIVDNTETTKILKLIFDTLKSLLGTLQGSNILISLQDETNVLDEYKKLVYGERMNIHQDLYAMQSKSLELIPFIETLQNQYSVTDKADGDRHFLFCINNKVYLINNNLIVRQIKVTNAENFNSTILDGEVIVHNNKQIFLAFDILFDRGVDIRTEVNLTTRYLKLKNIMEGLADLSYPWVKIESPEKFSIQNQVKYHEGNMDKHYSLLNKEVNSDKQYILFLKYFIFPTGGDKSEIYSYAHSMWNKYTLEYKLPYTLDGLIFTPLKQKYTRNIDDIKFQIYKWKPKEKNSIDLYIEFERDSKTKEILTVFDNSLIESGNQEFDDAEEQKNALYQIVKLYVGRVNFGTNIEIPVFFKPNFDLNTAHLYLKEGNLPRDVEGNIIQDKTVVEFTYDTIQNNDPKKKWIPLRTRFDKTEMVQKYKRKYGNSEKIADSIWQSMNLLIEMNDFLIMSNPETYEEHINMLRSKLTAKDIAMYKASDVYYSKKSNLGKTFRNFHNFVKTQYIYNYCSAVEDKKLDILDVGIGRGGELNKYFSARVKSIVGIDVDVEGLFSAGTDSTIGRYLNMKKKFPNFPPTDLVHASFGISLFKPDLQFSGLQNMTEQNKKNISKINAKKYDVISAMFSIHYLFKDDESVNAMIENFSLLKPGGYFIATLFDGNLLHNKFKTLDKKSVVEEYYTTDSGEKELLFSIKALYDLNTKNLNANGLAISYFLSTFMTDSSEYVEYLVTPEHLISTMKKAKLELVETETFENIYAMSKDFLMEGINYDAGKDTQQYLKDVREYYDMSKSINKAGFEMSRLYRVYVFRKN